MYLITTSATSYVMNGVAVDGGWIDWIDAENRLLLPAQEDVVVVDAILVSGNKVARKRLGDSNTAPNQTYNWNYTKLFGRSL
jgi:hypothetical protein